MAVAASICRRICARPQGCPTAMQLELCKFKVSCHVVLILALAIHYHYISTHPFFRRFPISFLSVVGALTQGKTDAYLIMQCRDALDS